MVSSTEWAVPGDLDAGTWYGEQFHAIDDLMFPGGERAEQAADFLIGLAGRPDPTVIEVGVGTGRIALPLARRGAVVTGVDVSPLMLDACRAAMGPADPWVQLIEADVREWRSEYRADLVVGVNGTLSFLATQADQRRAMRSVAAAVRPGGTVVIENHRADFVRSLHRGQSSVELMLPLPGASGKVQVTSLFDEDAGLWQIEYRWTDDAGDPGTAIERVRLVDPQEQIVMAAEVGLSWQATCGDWVGTSAERHSPTYVCVFSAPDIPDAA